jgi:hypothetical protein
VQEFAVRAGRRRAPEPFRDRPSVKIERHQRFKRRLQ